jgi:ribosomal protein S18 acetylase RimI-like enzyme
METNSSLVIRQMLPEDNVRLKGIVDSSFPRFFRYFALHSLHSEEGTVLVAQREGAVAGFAKLIWFTIKNEQYGCILWLAVDPNMRRKGYATALVDAGTKHLQAHGSKAVFASVQRRNKASLATFAKEGFSRIGFLGLWKLFGWRVFSFYGDIWFAPGEIAVIKETKK